jgi:hypothetical protein
MIGVDLAIKVVQRLLSPSGGVVLEGCRALWMFQGLYEKSNYETFQNMYTKFNTDHERLEIELEARLSVAATGMADTVVLMNDRERQIFQHQARQQQQQIVNQSAWSFRQLLYLQQVVLSKLDVPGFEDGATVDVESLQLQSYVCQYLHSAFYIRNRMGSEPHESMLRSQLKKLLREQDQQHQTGSNSPKIESQSIRTSSPMIRHTGSPIPHSMQQQQQPQQYHSGISVPVPMIPQMPSQLYNNSYQQPPQMSYPLQQSYQLVVQGNSMIYPSQASMMAMMSQQQQQYMPQGTFYNGNQMLPQEQQQQQQQQYLPSLSTLQQMQHGQAISSSTSQPSAPPQFSNRGILLPPPPTHQQAPPSYPPYYQQQ